MRLRYCRPGRLALAAAILGGGLGLPTQGAGQVRTITPTLNSSAGPAPLHAVATATSPTTISVTWDPAAAVRAYQVDRTQTDTPACCALSSGPIASNGWQDGNLQSGTQYTYTISVFYTDGRLGSAVVTAITPMPAIRVPRIASGGDLFSLTPCAQKSSNGPPPAMLEVEGQSVAGASLVWPVVAANYVVHRSPEANISWSLVGSTCGGVSPIRVASYKAHLTDRLGGVQPGVPYIYRVTAVGPNGEVGWTTVRWRPPCAGTIQLSTTVNGNAVTVSGRYVSCEASAIPEVGPNQFAISTSFGYTATMPPGPPSFRDFNFTVYGVPLGTHTFTVVANWYAGGASQPASVQATVSY